MSDPWVVLGVPPGASLDAARDAYLVRLQLLHPDHHQGMGPAVVAEADRATRELNAAWGTVQRLLSAGQPSPDPAPSRPPGAAPGPPGPPATPAGCLQWAIDRLVAAALREGQPLTAAEVELLRRPRAAAPSGRRFRRWLASRRRTLAGAVAVDGADAWAAAVRVLIDDGPAVVLAMLFSS
jgi:hypothetical protein